MLRSLRLRPSDAVSPGGSMSRMMPWERRMLRVGSGLSALTALALPWSAAAQSAPSEADVGVGGAAAVSLDVAAPSAAASPAATASASDAETEAALAALV